MSDKLVSACRSLGNAYKSELPTSYPQLVGQCLQRFQRFRVALATRQFLLI